MRFKMDRRRSLKNMGGLALLIPTKGVGRQDNNFFDQWKDQFMTRWETGHTYSTAILEAMPTEDFSFAPTVSQMSFGKQFTHFSYWNNFYLSFIKNTDPTPEPEVIKHETVLDYLQKMHDINTALIQSIEPEIFFKDNWTDQPYWKDHTTCDFLTRAYMHTTHHRAQAISFLRAKEIEPPFFMF